MDIQELSRWTDEAVFTKTGKHLDSLQSSILEGVLKHQNFNEIQEEINGYSYDHVKKEGAKLWKLLSDVFDEEIKQNNVRSILKNKAATIYNFGDSANIVTSNISHINICTEQSQSLKEGEKQSPQSKVEEQSPLIDLQQAPKLNYSYGRVSEITILQEWLINKTKLITLYGLSGVGKTALVLKLVSEISVDFDYIVYRSLIHPPKLIDLQNDLQNFFSKSQINSPLEIIDSLRQSRCLVILDDIQCIFQAGQLAGHYLEKYRDYSDFFKQIATLDHGSCFVIISSEKPQEIGILEADNKEVQSLQLSGLGTDAKEIFKQNNLRDEEYWDSLIEIYKGHPSWLKIISSTIVDLFDHRVSFFFSEVDQLFLGDIEFELDKYMKRLSDSEREFIYWLANYNMSLDIKTKPVDLQIPKTQYLRIIQSLMRRSLLEKIVTADFVTFHLNEVIKVFASNTMR